MSYLTETPHWFLLKISVFVLVNHVLRLPIILAFIAAMYILGACSGPLPEHVEQEFEMLPEYVDYNFDIKPILSDRCYTCHGPDPESRKAGLRLDIEQEAFKELQTGNFAFVKGSINKSEVIHRILSDDPFCHAST